MKNLVLLLFVSITFTTVAQDKCLSGDCKNGFGKLECECGYTFEGEFKDGNKVHGKLVKKELTYIGDFKDDMAHGKGEITYKDGSSYKGAFAFSEPDGIGVYKLTNGFVYTGQISAGYFKGWGEKLKIVADSSIVEHYLGSFNQDQLSGIGVHEYPSGIREYGQFEKNKLNGLGLIVYQDGGVEIGNYKKGKLVEEYALKEQGVVSVSKELNNSELVVKTSKIGGEISELNLADSEVIWRISFSESQIEMYANGENHVFTLKN